MQTGTGGPFLAGQVVGTKDFIYEWKNGSKVFTVIPWVFAMVPVVVLRCGNNVFQEAEINPGVGMNKTRHRMAVKRI